QINKSQQQIVISAQLASAVCDYFPWSQKGAECFKDLRHFVFQLLGKAHYVEEVEYTKLTIKQTDISCTQNVDDKIALYWEQLLASCAITLDQNTFDTKIAICDNQSKLTELEINIELKHPIESIYSRNYQYPLVWDEYSWAKHLLIYYKLSWPDNIEKIIELNYLANDALRRHTSTKNTHLRITYSNGFMSSLDKYSTDNYIRDSFIEALTKLVYNLHDKGLSLEKIGSGSVYRFRVTDSIRVHCRIRNDTVLLEKLGSHRIDGIG
ncbi:MAG: hypothetical protein U9N44_06455, partial [Chloroflexota bacterium]|nr:hypothetical protein [Chloroflexota bacterium]